MPELRRDPLSERWTVVAPERERRPAPASAEASGGAGPCPFCEGSESATPPEIHAYRRPGSHANAPGWRVRTIPNRRPALRIEGDLEPRAEGLYDRLNGVGAHEVIIDAPRHVRSIADLTPSEIEELLWMYRDRLLDLKRDRRLVYGLVCKSVGAAAGATLEHSHSQLVCLPAVPRAVEEELSRAREHHARRGRCLLCDILRQEVAAHARVVSESGSVVALVPYSARFPFETWLIPRRHRSHFEDVDRQEIPALAACLRATLRRLERALDRPAYGLWIRSAPFDRSTSLEWYHWRLEVVPRLYPPSALEQATDVSINPVAPERAAEYLRTLELEET